MWEEMYEGLTYKYYFKKCWEVLVKFVICKLQSPQSKKSEVLFLDKTFRDFLCGFPLWTLISSHNPKACSLINRLIALCVCV